MTDPIKFGDSSDASGILSDALDLDGLTRDECEDRGMERPAADLLTRVIGWGREGEITLKERALLENHFTDEFIEVLAGPKDSHDPALSLKKRVAWMADEIDTRWYRFIVFERKPEERARLIQEMGDIGIYAKDGMAGIFEGLSDDNPLINGASVEAVGTIGKEAAAHDPELKKILVARAVPKLRTALRNASSSSMPRLLKSLGEISPGREVIEDLRWALGEDKPWQVRQAACYALGAQGGDAFEALPDLRRALTGNFWVAKEAARALGKIVPTLKDEKLVREIVQDLIPLLGHTEDFVQSAARFALMTIGRPALRELVTALNDSSPQKRGKIHRHAASIVGEIVRRRLATDPTVSTDLLDRAIPALLRIFEEEESEAVYADVRSALLQVGLIVGPDIFRPLLDAMRSPDARVVKNVSKILGALAGSFPADRDEIRKICREEVVPRLTELVSHPDDGIRLDAISALGRIGPDAATATPTLIASLMTRRDNERAAIRKTLVELGLEVIGPVIDASKNCPIEKRGELIAVLKELKNGSISPLIGAMGGNERQRDFAILALADIGDVAVEPLLHEAVDGTNVDRREAAVRALGIIVPLDYDSVAAMVDLLPDPEVVVRSRVAEALVEVALRSNDLITRLSKMVADPATKGEAASGAASILGEVGQRTIHDVSSRRFLLEALALPPLVAALSGPSDLLRSTAVEALSKIGGPALLKVAELFDHDEAKVRETAIKIVVAYREKGIPLMVEKLRATSDKVRASAHDALVILGNPAAPELARALRNQPPAHHEAVIGVLTDLRPYPFDVLLWLSADDSRKETQQAALTALQRIGAPAIGPVCDFIDRSPDGAKKAVGIKILQRIARRKGEERPPEPAVMEALVSRGIRSLVLVTGAEGDSFADARKGAQALLTLIGSSALSPLLEGIRNPANDQHRNIAVAVIGDIGEKLGDPESLRRLSREIVPELIPLLADPTVVSATEEALVKIGYASVPALIAQKDGPNADAAESVLHQISTAKETLLPRAEFLLSDPDWRVREWGLNQLKNLIEDPAGPSEFPAPVVEKVDSLADRDGRGSNRILAGDLLDLLRERGEERE